MPERGLKTDNFLVWQKIATVAASLFCLVAKTTVTAMKG